MPCQVDPLAHGWREATCRILLEGDKFSAPVSRGQAVGPVMDLEQVHQHLVQITLIGMELGQPHVLDLLNDMLPVHFVHPLAARGAGAAGWLAAPTRRERRGRIAR